MKKNLFALTILFGIFIFPALARAADLYMILDKNQVPERGVFSATVYVSTAGLPINNAEATIHFPTDLLSIDSVSNTGSIFNIWVEQPTFSNSAGTVYFNGGLPTPGYSGESGQALKINFRAKKVGLANVSFGTSAVRANDGSGTNVLVGARGTTVSVVSGTPNLPPAVIPPTVTEPPPVQQTTPGVPRAPIITSNDMPDQNAWFNKTEATFFWDIPSDVSAVRLVLSTSPNTAPSINYDPPIGSKYLSNLNDGILYLNGQFRNSFGWGRIASRKIQIDTTEPTDLSLKTDITENDLISIEASAKDALSGMGSFTVLNGSEKIAEASAKANNEPVKFSLPPLESGNHKLSLRAYDKAGNYIESDFSIEAPKTKSPKITHYPEYIKVGSKIEIRGKSPYVGTEVNVWIKEEGKNAESHLVRPDEDKIFSFTSDTIDETGNISVWAETIRSGGVKSAPSEKVYVSVKESDAVWLGTRAIQIISVAITFLILVFGLLALIYFGIRKLNAIKRKLRRDLIHTEQEVHKVFQILKGDTKRHVKMLEKASTKRKLTKEEGIILADLSEGLDETEKYLSQKIKNIQKEDL